MDDPRLTWINFERPPQPRDLHIDAANKNFVMDACRLRQMFS